ncbi:tetratricopeptide repeat protein [Streptomyces orinoci]|uniref:Tetratricopeptide repeat protein n=1 Tax=Streptomyces orinoci TaxID=67339 RepID=A0ABV3K4Z9_STRON|nr:tetratricopeptide repeat protein [Streptomyces orinoci]
MSLPVQWLYIRDTIKVNDQLRQEIEAETAFHKLPPGAVLALVAREITHDQGYVLGVQDHPLLLVAETYSGNGGAIDTSGRPGPGGTTGTTGDRGGHRIDGQNGGPGGPGGSDAGPGGPGSPITLLAGQVTGLRLIARGGRGGAGGTGGRGGAGLDGHRPNKGGIDGTDPGDGGAGGHGGNGSTGGPGAAIVAEFITQSGLTADGSGGDAGPAGPGGAGGKGGGGNNGRGDDGPHGAPGSPGTAGPAVAPLLTAHAEGDWWALVRDRLGDNARAWADYRTRVGEYHFRGFAPGDPQKSGHRPLAGREFDRALVLWPGQAQAAELSRYVAANLSPIGQPYDLDLRPDFPQFEKVVTDYDTMVKSLFDNGLNLLLKAKDAGEKKQRLLADISHIDGMRTVLADEKNAAVLGVAEATARRDEALRRVRVNQAAIDAVLDQMDKERMEFPIGQVVSTVGAAATAVAGLVAFFALLAAETETRTAMPSSSADVEAAARYAAAAHLALGRAEAVQQFDLTTGTYQGQYLVEWMDWSDPGNPTPKADKKDDMGGLKDLLGVGKDIVDLGKTLNDLRIAEVSPGTAAQHKQLVQRQLELIADLNLAKLDLAQKNALVDLAQARIALNEQDRTTLHNVQEGWEADIGQESAIARMVIAQTQVFMDVLIKFAFMANRALDLWTFSAYAPKFSFDIGHLPPDDVENAYQPLSRGDDSRVLGLLNEYLTTWSRMPELVLLRDAYNTYENQLDSHNLRLTITTPAVLDALRTTGTATFEVTLDDFPAHLSELKTDGVHIGLVGATGNAKHIPVSVRHGGEAVNRLRDGSLIHLHAPARRGTDDATLDDSEPDYPVGSRPSFWGRSPATTWQISIDPDDARRTGLSLAGLSALKVSLFTRHYDAGTVTGPPPAPMTVQADFEGNGHPDTAEWHPDNGNWTVHLSTGSTVTVPWGRAGDFPVPADYDGDGKDEPAVWRPSNGKVYARPLASGPGTIRPYADPAYRPVPADHPGMARFAQACAVRAARLSEAGRAAETLAVARQARDTYRKLADADGSYTTALASASVFLGGYAQNAGLMTEAVTVTQEAVALYRRLADRPDLAWALENLAFRLSAANQPSGAVDAEREARDLYDRLAQTDPHAYQPRLANADVFLGAFLTQAGRHDEAITATRAGVDVYRRLADQPHLAWALFNLAYRCSAAGQSAAAVDAQRESRDVYAQLAQTDPTTYRPELANADVFLGAFLQQAGRHDEAIAAGSAGVDLYRQLADTPHLAWALENLAYRCSAAGRPSGAVDAEREARDLYDRLAQADPATHRPELANAALLLAGFLVQANRRAEARPAAQQAVDLYEQLAKGNPAVYGERLKEARQLRDSLPSGSPA